MMKLNNYIVVIFLVFAEFSSPKAVAAPTPIAFAQSPLLNNAQVSPDGRFFFARVSHGPRTVFTVFDLMQNGKVVASLTETERGVVEWASWANSDTILLQLGFLGGRRVKLNVESESQRYYTQSLSEVFVMPLSVEPGQVTESVWPLTTRGSLVSILHSDDDHVLVEENPWRDPFPDVYKKSIRNKGNAEKIQSGITDVYSWHADRAGQVRIGYGGKIGYSGRVKYKLLMKARGETKFRDLSRFYDDIDKRFTPLSFAEDPDHIYVSSNHETDTVALYLFDIREENFIDQIYHNPDFDVAAITTNEETGALINIIYGEDAAKIIWHDEDLNREIDNIERNFQGMDVFLQSFSADANAGIVSVASPTFAGQYYIYDRDRRELTPLPLQQETLPKSQMGKVLSAPYLARDGETIPAYVTLPPGVNSLSEAKNLPFVIFPHGGPAARDFLTFDKIAQFFATRGYGVLQMNFRGSAGYGLKYEIAGRRQWGRLMQDDISDGVGSLISEGIADPERIAIFGHSYGGYAALMGAVLTPELYQCAVSFAGVTSLPSLVAGEHKDNYVSRLVGDRFRESDELREYSPLFRAKDFGVPVLLIHGRLDGVVPYDHAEDLDYRLRRAGKEVEFVTLPRSAHGLNDYDDRVRFFEKLDEYFADCLPVKS